MRQRYYSSLVLRFTALTNQVPSQLYMTVLLHVVAFDFAFLTLLSCIPQHYLFCPSDDLASDKNHHHVIRMGKLSIFILN